jgi:hypothetical protein
MLRKTAADKAYVERLFAEREAYPEDSPEAMAAFMGSRSVLPYSGFGRLFNLSSGAAFPTG